MIDFKNLADEYNTPLYVYDFDHITSQYTALTQATQKLDSLICYAIKANSNLSVIKHITSLGAGCDCVSIGEVKRALLVGVPSHKIIFSGVGKTKEEIREAIKSNLLFINIESKAELKQIMEQAKELNKTVQISIRVNPNIDPKTHPYISTGLHESKFGVTINRAKELYQIANQSKYVKPLGIHFHIGSQLTELEPFMEACQVVSNMVKELASKGIVIKYFDVGGGLGIKYHNEKPLDLCKYTQIIQEATENLNLKILFEPGRFLIGNAGYFITKVIGEKKNGKKRFIIVDGAMNDLIRPSLYNSFHKIELLTKNTDITKTDVVGPVCESGDFFAKDILLPKASEEDLLVIHSAGAYCFSLASNYNTRGRAAEVAYKADHSKLVREREDFNDLIAKEIHYLDQDILQSVS